MMHLQGNKDILTERKRRPKDLIEITLWKVVSVRQKGWQIAVLSDVSPKGVFKKYNKKKHFFFF